MVTQSHLILKRHLTNPSSSIRSDRNAAKTWERVLDPESITTLPNRESVTHAFSCRSWSWGAPFYLYKYTTVPAGRKPKEGLVITETPNVHYHISNPVAPSVCSEHQFTSQPQEAFLTLSPFGTHTPH